MNEKKDNKFYKIPSFIKIIKDNSELENFTILEQNKYAIHVFGEDKKEAYNKLIELTKNIKANALIELQSFTKEYNKYSVNKYTIEYHYIAIPILI